MIKGKAILIGSEDEENLAIRYLGANLTKNKHAVRIVACSREDDFPTVSDGVISFRPDMVAVSMAFQSLAPMFLELMEKINQIRPEVHVTVGGHFPTFEYLRLLEYPTIDSVIRFEGEEPITLLLEAIINNSDFDNIPNLVYKENSAIKENSCQVRFPNLDLLPF
ncbi:MAG: cobalamin-dependent protein, partial [Methanobacteriaceae archaeon]|nr:cobalamin-dependent protein [Methanobacteriaceae archaeon]